MPSPEPQRPWGRRSIEGGGAPFTIAAESAAGITGMDLEVHVRTPEGEVFQGRCVDIESALHEVFVSVEFPADQAPALRTGATNEIEFRGGGLDTSIRTDARPILRTDDAARRCYCFRGTLTKSALLSLVDRRRATRVRPPASEPVRVKLLDLAGAPEVLLHDISATGVSILVEPELEEQLFTRLRLRLAVRLPREDRDVEMTTAVRHRRVVGSAILYGLEIDGQIPELLRADNRFLVYVSSLRSQQLGSGE